MDTTKSKAPGGDVPPEAPAKRAAEGARRGHVMAYSASTSPPCGACKFLRRKCIGGCIFAPHFGMDQGAARFAAVHKVFGASNVSKLLQNVPVGRRSDAVVTICYEAQARLSDPVYGCVSTILALQQQVSTLQAEFSVVQSQLIHNRWVAAGAIQGSEQPHLITTTLQPAFSNNSSTCNNLAPTSTRPDTTHIFQPLQLSQPSKCDEEEESRNTVDFANGVFDSK